MKFKHEIVVNSTSAATSAVFSTMLAMEIQPGEPYLESNPCVSDGVVSFIGLAGEWAGTGILSCSAGFACKMASQLLMTEYEPGNGAVSEDVLDAVAEVTNMIIGNVKNSLEDHLGPMGMSIPTVIYGRNFTTRSVGKGEWVVMPFSSGQENMKVSVCITESHEPRPVRHGFASPALQFRNAGADD